MWGALIEGLNWQRILYDIESNAASITLRLYIWHLYEFGSRQGLNDAQGRLQFDDFLNLFRQNESDIRGHLPPASRSAVESLTTQIKVEGRTDAFCCICQDKIVVGETSTQMPCKHEFHRECIDQWLTSINCCPFSKDELPTD